MSSPRISIFVKFMGALLIVVLLVGFLAAGLAPRAVKNQFQLYVDNSRRRQAEAFANVLGNYYTRTGSWSGVETILHDPLPRLSQDDGRNGRHPPGRDIWQAMGARALIINSDGIVVADSEREMEGETVSQEALRAGAPIRADGRQIGTAIIAVQSQTSVAQTLFVQQMNRVIIIAVIIAGAVALLLGAAITWSIIRPLRQLTAAADAIAQGDFNQRIPSAANDEIGDLALAFNKMSGQLDRSETLRRQMTADIAHELRTPLTVIQGNIEALQDGIFPLTTNSLDPIADKTEMLARLIEDLRQLALAEAGQLQLDRHPADVGELIKRTVAAFLPIAGAEDIALSVETEPNLLETAVDSQRIEQILNNLIANAIRHTPNGGSVSVECSTTDQTLLITVSDTGDGVPADMLPNIFERFTRADQSRARTDGGGTGLGLAVARSIVEAHGGKIGAKNNADGGAMFWFTLPKILN